LNKLLEYFQTWKLNINFDKTIVIIFNKGTKNFDKMNFYCGESKVEITEKYKYLVLIFNYNRNLKHSAEDLYIKKRGLKSFF
jgi:hypothetical protein